MNTLILVAFLSDLLTPFLIWKAGLPAEFRWIAQVALLLAMGHLSASLLRQRSTNTAILLVAALSLIGIVTASVEGQGALATAWGWWLMFKYPLVGLYVYFQPRWPERFPAGLLKWSILLVGFEVVVQLAQYAAGQVPGDNLAGSLGRMATGDLVLVILWVLALTLGEWIAGGKLRWFALVTALGAVSSALGEMKLFPFAAGLMTLIAGVIYLVRGRRLVLLLPYAVFFAALVIVFPSLYNDIVPDARKMPFSEYLDPRVLTQYMGGVDYGRYGYDVGRDYALGYVWDQISASPVTIAFGDGLGSRGDSKTLGTAGISLLSQNLGLFTGNSIVVIMGELGITGLLSLVGFVLWATYVLWKSSASNIARHTAGLQYALLIYTILWPLWAWYATSWTSPVPMLLYWSALGYCLAQVRREVDRG